VDKLLDRDAYRALGYRQCGERAVRVDILERLADLIRPALSWREGSLGEKPAGAFDGRGFVITQAMTSLHRLGRRGILPRSCAPLGYRMEKRPPLPPAPPKPVVVGRAAGGCRARSGRCCARSGWLARAPSADAIPAVEATTPLKARLAPPNPVASELAIAAEPGEAIADAAHDAPRPNVAPSLALLPNVVFAAVTTPREPAPIDAKPDEATLVAEAVAAEAPPQQISADAVAADAAATAADVAPASDVVTASDGYSFERGSSHDRWWRPRRDSCTSEVVVASETAVASEAPGAGRGLASRWPVRGAPTRATIAAATAIRIVRPPWHSRQSPRARRARASSASATAADDAERHGGDFHQRPRTDAPAAAAAAPAAATRERACPRAARRQGAAAARTFPRQGPQGPGQDRDNKGRDKGKFGGSPKGGRDGRADGGASHRQYAPAHRRANAIDRSIPIRPSPSWRRSRSSSRPIARISADARFLEPDRQVGS